MCIYSEFADPRAFQIVVGTDRLDNVSTSHSVIISYMYPLYANDNLNFDFDLAMLKVEIPFELGTENVQSIEIAALDHPDFEDGTIGVIAGWGSTVNGGPISFQLNSVELQTINNEECAERTIQPVTENMLCAHPLGDTDAGMCHVRLN